MLEQWLGPSARRRSGGVSIDWIVPLGIPPRLTVGTHARDGKEPSLGNGLRCSQQVLTKCDFCPVL